jgi:tmRNA-binding protein
MADPLPPQHFALLLQQAGITLPPEEVESLRQAHAKLADMLALLRQPGVPLAAEPAFTFKAGEGA